jgi:hypothetical protein
MTKQETHTQITREIAKEAKALKALEAKAEKSRLEHQDSIARYNQARKELLLHQQTQQQTLAAYTRAQQAASDQQAKIARLKGQLMGISTAGGSSQA